MTKIAILQLNPIVGDLAANKEMILASYIEAANSGADLAIAPECVLTGYPIEDLVLRYSFITAAQKFSDELCQDVLDSGYSTTLIFGTPLTSGDIRNRFNAAILIDPLSKSSPVDPLNFYQRQTVYKYELPNYGVFDEKRVFQPGPHSPYTVSWRGYVLGLMICEDCWFPAVTRELYDQGATILIAINGSPFESGKNLTRQTVVADRIKETGLPFVYVNLVGGQDELVFDGGSFVYDGKRINQFPFFEEGNFYFDIELVKDTRRSDGERLIFRDDGISVGWINPPIPLVTLDNYIFSEPSGIGSIYRATVLGTRDYMRKQGFKSAVIGMSGGIDSAIVAGIACDAIGPENVHLVRLPSKYSSQHSLDDASTATDRLGALMRTITIEPVVDALREAYANSSDHGYYPEFNTYDGGNIPTKIRKLAGIADENIQARARGTILMAISNQEGHLLLTTGNRSEVSVGYSTLYGDMSGGFNPIKDCYKTTVWDLCRWRNNLTTLELHDYNFLGHAVDVVPESIIVKPPSAELRPDQKDEDSLPAYPILDAILSGILDQELSSKEISANLNLDINTVQRIRNLVDQAEYKRRQAAPGIKISGKLFGRERRYPIVNKWRD